jgi:hypothetical protein
VPPQPIAYITSQTKEKIQRAIGKGINIGWIGCLRKLAGPAMTISFFLKRMSSISSPSVLARKAVKGHRAVGLLLLSGLQ